MGLVARQVDGLAVDRAACRDIDHPLDGMPLGALDHIERAQNVHVGVKERFTDRTAHVHLGRMVANEIRPLGRKDSVELRAADVNLVELGRRVQIRPAAG
jgi:hypothetical protein